MIVQINDYFIGMIFKGNRLVRNTIPLREEEIFRFYNGKILDEPNKMCMKVGKIILKLYFADLDDKIARDLIDYELNVSSFTKKVLDEVKKIKFGETVSYGDIAKKLNTSPRAVGVALSKNPLPLIIPCHRVVAKNSLGGYSYGIEKKKFILEMEQIKKRLK
ncbi:methylated-DNA/protein-cysteine methyltransferase [Methanocaldococcus vulcanius M7]|uniref:Methylated-DNA--protein-cysteine methyltransferase n=1 Tax=Methanocaldococcus vulcanius (strain ATCC 700851 / DSM 12094 / M7) TaxID=579137 RepID=OGT_METVM|nr:methylated-DNA--[protein]-cysteine S-methyltransferase [Methanocaldococcus vulcanius]C9RE37.1 RecName: Full=Methylated-DNA--protein-cysteine methyltransferase; AltName: Full=6-O-methylguanine-DNA methyltransferase; Short=MGMT; AltName: Full=O-6-methylguanine-DNA-alkyltransferase [Methanocaldococcus vulcanius M7]ACX73566.1 methylated-DNA/protein-cysteine methyltransferase [Methanocaldococcus vulcanius M7]